MAAKIENDALYRQNELLKILEINYSTLISWERQGLKRNQRGRVVYYKGELVNKFIEEGEL